MKLRKVSAASAAVLALALTATACGGDDKDSGSSDGGGKKITIGIKFDQPGLGQKTPDGYAGFDVDVATYVAKKLGYTEDQIEWKESKSADRETMLQRGDVDFIAATYSITPERSEKVDFAGPYLLAHQDVLIRADDDKIKSPEDLNDAKLCSVTGSTSAQNVKDKLAPKAQLQKYPTYSACLNGLQTGAIDALTTDDSILAGYAAQSQFKGKFKLGGFKMTNENYGIGVKKGSDLKAKINDALEAMATDGAWDKAVKDNFGPANYKNEPAPKIGDIKTAGDQAPARRRAPGRSTTGKRGGAASDNPRPEGCARWGVVAPLPRHHRRTSQPRVRAVQVPRAGHTCRPGQGRLGRTADADDDRRPRRPHRLLPGRRRHRAHHPGRHRSLLATCDSAAHRARRGARRHGRGRARRQSDAGGTDPHRHRYGRRGVGARPPRCFTPRPP